MGSAASPPQGLDGAMPSPGAVLPSPAPGAPLPSTGGPSTAIASPAAATHSAAASPAVAATTPLSPGMVTGAEREEAQPLPWPTTPDGQDEVCSFFNLARAPPGGADVAARRFLNLLSMHMEGTVVLTQEEDYGDIAVHRGPDWPGGLVV